MILVSIIIKFKFNFYLTLKSTKYYNTKDTLL